MKTIFLILKRFFKIVPKNHFINVTSKIQGGRNVILSINVIYERPHRKENKEK